MSRYLGPKHKLCRRVGMRLCANAKCPSTRRNYGPGIHGQNKRKKQTEYGEQLLEKQKAKQTYGVLERQFRRYYEAATQKRGDTSVYLAQKLERRLDNIIYRFGAAKTRAHARQMVVHGHVLVNGKKVDRPSYAVRIDDKVSFAHPLKELEQREPLSWLSFDQKTMVGTITSDPKSEELPEKLKTRLIIEFYSR